MFGGNLPACTQVLTSYIFTKVEEGELGMAVTASAFCIILSLVMVSLFWLGKVGKQYAGD
jgi:molybdate transport system permease protein